VKREKELPSSNTEVKGGLRVGTKKKRERARAAPRKEEGREKKRKSEGQASVTRKAKKGMRRKKLAAGKRLPYYQDGASCYILKEASLSIPT